MIVQLIFVARVCDYGTTQTNKHVRTSLSWHFLGN